jgi:signal transduction histidine kinase
MSPLLDVRALFAATAVVFLGLTVAMALAWRELRRIPGLGHFATSYGLLLVGTALLASRDRIPDLLSVVVANVVLVLGTALIQEGMRTFNGAKPQRRLTLASSGGSAVAFSFFTYVVPSSLARTALSSLLLGLHLGCAAWTSWRGRPREYARLLDKVTSLALAMCAAVFAARAALTVRGLGQAGLLAGDVATVLVVLGGTLSAVIWTTTLLVNANQRLTAEVAAEKNLFAHLLAIAKRAGEGPSLDVTLADTLLVARSLTGATGASLLLVDERGAFDRGIHSVGAAQLAVGRELAEQLLAQGLAGWVARERETALVADILEDPRWQQLPSQAALIRSALVVPIASGPVLAGVLTLVHDRPSYFSDEDRRLLEAAGAQIALVLRNAQIADARLSTNRRQTLLIRVLRICAERRGAAEIAQAAAEAIKEQTGWPHVAVAIPGEDGRFHYHGEAAWLPSVRQPVGAGVTGRAQATGKTQHVADVSRDPDYLASLSEIRSELAVPVRPGDRTLGVLNLESPALDAFSPEDRDLAEALAEAIGLGLENARLSQAREDLTHTMVHDLRSPMVAITGSLTLLARSERLTTEDRKLLDMAQRNSRRQAALIEAILELGRLEDGATPLRPSRLLVGALAFEVLRLAAPLAQTRSIELVDDVPRDLPEAWADPDLLARVLENLVGNAIKFSPQGAGPVRVGAREVEDRVEVRVSDCGPGVDQTARARLFQKFARGDHRERGSGLGLAFCRLAVEANGGRLWLEESDGPGATFAFTLPLAPAGNEGRARA